MPLVTFEGLLRELLQEILRAREAFTRDFNELYSTLAEAPVPSDTPSTPFGRHSRSTPASR